MLRVYEKNLVEIYEVEPDLYFRKADLLTRGQCNSAYFTSGGRVGVVDVPTLEAAKEMAEESRLLFGRPISLVFLTHGHGDHIEGLPALLGQDITVFCSEQLRGRLPPPIGGSGATVVGVTGRTRLHMGTLEIECHALGVTAHSWADMLVRLPRDQYLCTGDLVVDFPMLYFHSANVENWIGQLKVVARESRGHIIPGHGDIYPCSRIGETAEFIETLAFAAEACLSRLAREQVETISEATIGDVVSGYLCGGDACATRIRQLAGADAHRELRMVLRYFIYARLI